MRMVAGLGIACLCLGLAGCASVSPSGPSAGSRTANYERAMVTLQVNARDPNAAIRANCVEALQSSEDPRAAEVIEQGLHDPQWVVRFASCMAAGKRKAANLKPVLLTLAKDDPNDSVRAGAVYGLYRMGDYTYLNLLLKTRNSPDASVRANTFMVFGLLGDKSIIGLLKVSIHERDPRAKFELTAALARLGDEDAQRVIASLVLSKVAEDQWNSLMVASDLPPDAVINSLLVAVKDPLPMQGHPRELEIRRQLLAARALGKMGKITGGKLALQYKKDASADVRALAALALGDLLLATEEYAVADMLSDPDPQVQIAAAAAVVNIWSKLEQTPTGAASGKQ